MVKLPESAEFRRSVFDEAWRQFRKSVGMKVAVLAVGVVAISVVVGLDFLKRELRDSVQKPYRAAVVADQATAVQSSLKDKVAAADLAAAAEKLKAHDALVANDGYSTSEDLYNALLAQTTYANDAVTQQQKIRATFDKLIRDVDPSVDQRAAALSDAVAGAMKSVAASPGVRAAADKAIEEAKKGLEAAKNNRAELIAARTARLAEVDQSVAANRTAFRLAFEGSRIAETARKRFEVASSYEKLNAFAKNLADPDHPLSILYDVIWYAALVVAVLALVALLLAPIFKAIPVAGADETFKGKLSNILGRAPTLVGKGVISVAAATIGTAAVLSVATTAPSSPLYESKVIWTTESGPKQPETPGNGPHGTPPPIASTTGTTSGPSSSTDTGTTTTTTTSTTTTSTTSSCIPACEVVPATDTRVDALLSDVDNMKQRGSEAASQFDKRITAIEGLSQRLTTFASEESAQKTELNQTFATIRDRLSSDEKRVSAAEVNADFAQQSAMAAQQALNAASRKIETRADAIETGVVLPYQIGERPGVLQTLFGFDRYRVSTASKSFLQKAGAPENVVTAVSEIAGPKVLTNDELREKLRLKLCGGRENCPDYLAWRATVLRAARL